MARFSIFISLRLIFISLCGGFISLRLAFNSLRWGFPFLVSGAEQPAAAKKGTVFGAYPFENASPLTKSAGRSSL
jgi:hypothetical protein